MQTLTALINYTYDADGIRVSSSVDGNVTNYLVDKNRDYAQVLEERDSGAGLIASYVYGDDLISMDRGRVASFYHYDGNGNTRQLTDFSENITDRYMYDAFGIMLEKAGVTENNYLYTSEQYDMNVGYYYLRARYYEPASGRFKTPDTISGNLFDLQTLHKYIYVNGNPVNLTDPSGKFSMTATATVAAITALLVGIVVPTLQTLIPRFAGNTDRFSLQFSVGGGLGYILFVGLINVYIWERPSSNRFYSHCRRGLFQVILIGLGGGASGGQGDAIASGTPKTFSTSGKRRIEDFQGIGRITMLQLTAGLVGFGIAAIHLPDGTYLEPSFGASIDIGLGLSDFTVMSIWKLTRVEQLW